MSAADLTGRPPAFRKGPAPGLPAICRLWPRQKLCRGFRLLIKAAGTLKDARAGDYATIERMFELFVQGDSMFWFKSLHARKRMGRSAREDHT